MPKKKYSAPRTLLLILAFIFFSSNNWATVRLGSIDPARNTTLPNWTGTAGNVTSLTTFCVTSTNGAGLAVPYQIRVYNQTGGAGNPFTLTSAGKPDLTVSWQFSDLFNPGYETLSPNVYTAFNKTGSSACSGGGAADNAALLMTINQADLQSAEAGTYTRKFTVEMLGGVGGTENRKVALGVTITIVPLILISGLNDITFPLFSGIDLTASDSLCVYRNGPGTYTVTATGSGAANAFTIAFSGNTLPYTVTWNDGSTSTTLTTAVVSAGQQNASTTNMSCTNATVNLAISAANLSAVPYGTYTGILTLLVAPL